MFLSPSLFHSACNLEDNFSFNFIYPIFSSPVLWSCYLSIFHYHFDWLIFLFNQGTLNYICFQFQSPSLNPFEYPFIFIFKWIFTFGIIFLFPASFSSKSAIYHLNTQLIHKYFTLLWGLSFYLILLIKLWMTMHSNYFSRKLHT